MVTAGAITGKLIAGFCRPTALAAYDVIDGELLGAAFIAEFTGIHRTAEAGPTGGRSGRRRGGSGGTAALTELSGVFTAAGITFPGSRSRCDALGLRHGCCRAHSFGAEPILCLRHSLGNSCLNTRFVRVVHGQHAMKGWAPVRITTKEPFFIDFSSSGLMSGRSVICKL